MVQPNDVQQIINAMYELYNLLENFLDDFSHEFLEYELPPKQDAMYDMLTDLRDELLDKTTEIEVAVGILDEDEDDFTDLDIWSGRIVTTLLTDE